MAARFEVWWPLPRRWLSHRVGALTGSTQGWPGWQVASYSHHEPGMALGQPPWLPPPSHPGEQRGGQPQPLTRTRSRAGCGPVGWRATPTLTGEARGFRPPSRPAPMPQGQLAPARHAAQPGVQHSWLPLFCAQFASPMGWACPAERGFPPPLPQWRTRKSPQWERVVLLHAQPLFPRH